MTQEEESDRIARYDLTDVTATQAIQAEPGDVFTATARFTKEPDGEWVRYEDHATALRTAREEGYRQRAGGCGQEDPSMTDLTSLDLVERLTKIADASRRADGTDIPLGEDLREAAAEVLRLRALTAQGEGCETTLGEREALNTLAEEIDNGGVPGADEPSRLLAVGILRVLRDLTRADARANEATAALSRERDVVQELGLQLHEARAALSQLRSPTDG